MYDFITRDEFIPLTKEVQQLRAELDLWRKQTDEYLNTIQTMRLLGCSRRWLEVERNRPGTLLVVSYLNSKPTYSRASLIALQAARTIHTHNTNNTHRNPSI